MSELKKDTVAENTAEVKTKKADDKRLRPKKPKSLRKTRKTADLRIS